MEVDTEKVMENYLVKRKVLDAQEIMKLREERGIFQGDLCGGRMVIMV
jgi:hypothetical protein